jgi:hypothetical protein
MLGFGVVIALMIVSNAFVLIQLNNISTSAKATLTNNVTSIDLVKRLQSILIDEERNAQKFIISRLTTTCLLRVRLNSIHTPIHCVSLPSGRMVWSQ